MRVDVQSTWQVCPCTPKRSAARPTSTSRASRRSTSSSSTASSPHVPQSAHRYAAEPYHLILFVRSFRSFARSLGGSLARSLPHSFARLIRSLGGSF
eukprot:3355068-Prymnesium_polylepis.2